MGNVQIKQLPLVRSQPIFDELPMPHSAETKAGTTYGVKERRDLGSFHEPRSSIVALTHFGVSGIRSTNRWVDSHVVLSSRPSRHCWNLQFSSAIHFYNSQDHLEIKKKNLHFCPQLGSNSVPSEHWSNTMHSRPTGRLYSSSEKNERSDVTFFSIPKRGFSPFLSPPLDLGGRTWYSGSSQMLVPLRFLYSFYRTTNR